jgi:hypothetical protein
MSRLTLHADTDCEPDRSDHLAPHSDFGKTENALPDRAQPEIYLRSEQLRLRVTRFELHGLVRFVIFYFMQSALTLKIILLDCPAV